MTTKKAQRQWDRTPDLALPEERALLDELLKVRPDMGPLRISSREGPGFGEFRSAVTLCYRMVGCFIIDVKWIRAEIESCKEAARKERRRARYRGRQEALRDTAAYI